MITADISSPVYRGFLLNIAAEVEVMHAPVEYHHFGHAMEEVFPGTRYIAELVIRQGVKVDLLITDPASISHDALVHVPLTNTTYATKEERTADVMGNIFERYGMPELQIIGAQGAIISTNMDEPLLKPEDAILNYADIINIAGDYDAMLQKTYNYWIETQRLSNKFIDPAEWLTTSIEILTKYVNKELPKELVNVYPFPLLRARMTANLERMKRETPETFLAKITPLPTAPVFS